MKKNRQAKIIELIGLHEVETQEELVRLLRDSGFAVTQATVSRDIKDMRLIKVMSDDGQRYKYAQDMQRPEQGVDYNRVLEQSIHKVDYSGNLLVVKCHAGMAQAAGAAIDATDYDGIVGSVAGDDTILIVMRTLEDAQSLAAELKRIRAGR